MAIQNHCILKYRTQADSQESQGSRTNLSKVNGQASGQEFDQGHGLTYSICV